MIVYSVGFAVLKYEYGYSYIVGYGKLCFWLFLVNSGSANQDWFRTLYFKIWAAGSCIAMIFMPLVTISTRGDLTKCEAYTFLAGSLGSLCLTIWFLPILWTFHSFIDNMKYAGVDKNTLIRLTKFHELNCIRIVSRFLFTIPLLILGIDGARLHQHINDKIWLITGTNISYSVDLLAMVACIGVVVSSGLTLVIFFPRSIEGEMAKKEAARERKRTVTPFQCPAGRQHSPAPSDVMYILPPAPANASTGFVQSNGHDSGATDGPPSYKRISTVERETVECEHDYHCRHNNSHNQQSHRELDRGPRERYREEADHDIKFPGPVVILQPNRRNMDGDIEFGGVVNIARGAFDKCNITLTRAASVNYLVHNWRSPIDLEAFPGPLS
ncbi:hypothetical protein ID866_8426 [Astraeus odoratus]|nr:hypothetical protein ID866_8426 [Astraeus odoratus]